VNKRTWHVCAVIVVFLAVTISPHILSSRSSRAEQERKLGIFYSNVYSSARMLSIITDSMDRWDESVLTENRQMNPFDQALRELYRLDSSFRYAGLYISYEIQYNTTFGFGWFAGILASGVSIEGNQVIERSPVNGAMSRSGAALLAEMAQTLFDAAGGLIDHEHGVKNLSIAEFNELFAPFFAQYSFSAIRNRPYIAD